MNPIKYRVSQWFDSSKRQMVFGIQAKLDEAPGWWNVNNGQTPYFFHTKNEAKAEVKRLNQTLKNLPQNH